MSSHLVILLSDPGAVQPHLARQLAATLGTDSYNMRLLLRHEPPVLLRPMVPEASARVAVALLGAAGHEACQLDTAALRNVPDPVPIRTLDFQKDHLRLIRSETEMVLSPWDGLLLLVFARCRTRQSRRETIVRSPMRHPHGGESEGHIEHRVTTLLDIYLARGTPPVRIDAGRFSFGFLGVGPHSTHARKLQETVARIRQAAPGLVFHDRFEHMRGQLDWLGRSASDDFTIGGLSIVRNTQDDLPRFNLYSRLAYLIQQQAGPNT